MKPRSSCLAVLRSECYLAAESVGLARALFWFLLIAAKRLPRMCMQGLAVWLRLKSPYAQYAPKNYAPPSHKDNNGLRVLFCSSDNSASSGAFRSMVTLASLLKEQHGVKPLVALPYQGDGAELLDEAEIPYVIIQSCTWTVPLGTNIQSGRNSRGIISSLFTNHVAIMTLARMIRSYGVDIVHVNTTWTYAGALAAKASNVPCVWHLREFLEEDQGRTIWSRKAGNRTMATAEKAIAISESIYKKYSGTIPSDRLVTILNGIDAGRFLRPRHVVMNEEPYVFVFLGNFNEHKGHIEFSKACASLYADGLRVFRVLFIGGGDAIVREKCESIFAGVGMQNMVSYIGFQKQPEIFLEKADVAFMCSRFEAFGRVTVEAMMAGCLVVGAATAGTTELIKDGKTGLLFEYEYNEYSKLAAKMKEAIGNPERSRRIAASGREYAMANFTAERNANAVAALYRSIIEP